MRILTFDIEDWFHILDHKNTEHHSSWFNYECRIHHGVDTILNIVESNNIKASFFVVGWIAEKYPEVVKKISDLGYEIGTHSHYHQLAYNLDEFKFERDIEKSIKTIEDCIGKKILMFRAPGFSIKKNNIWAFEVLHKLGIEIDCSIFAAQRAHGGIHNYNINKPSIIRYNGISLKEFPINTYNFLGQRIVFSGGGYFRFFNYEIIKKMSNESQYIMSYFHPRDFDNNQPKLTNLGLLRNFKLYVGIDKCKSKLNRWLSDYKFSDINSANNKIDWSKLGVIDL